MCSIQLIVARLVISAGTPELGRGMYANGRERSVRSLWYPQTLDFSVPDEYPCLLRFCLFC
jgi:hypothetical protein